MERLSAPQTLTVSTRTTVVVVGNLITYIGMVIGGTIRTDILLNGSLNESTITFYMITCKTTQGVNT